MQVFSKFPQGFKSLDLIQVNKSFQIKKELQDIENGHLDSKLQPDALRQLRKRCQVCNEDLMKLLETYDSFSFQENQVFVSNQTQFSCYLRRFKLFYFSLKPNKFVKLLSTMRICHQTMVRPWFKKLTRLFLN